MLAVGDIMLGDQPACIGHGVRSQIEKKGAAFLFQRIAPALTDSDLSFGNVESVLSDDGFQPGSLKHLEFRGRPGYAAELARHGFNVMSVANNHAMQYGRRSFEECVAALEQADIRAIGVADIAGRSNCYRYAKNGFGVSCLAFSFRPDNYAIGPLPYANNPDIALEQIAEIRRSGDAIVVSVHWGEEYLNVPSAQQIGLAHRMIDAGASLILGHHPHVVQGVERYRNGAIAYSLGNFIADFWQDYARKSALLRCEITPDGIQRLELLPLWINREYQPTVPEAESMARLRSEFDGFDQQLVSVVSGLPHHDSTAYQALASRVYRKYRMESYRYFLRNIYRYRPTMIYQSLARFIDRRVSSD